MSAAVVTASFVVVKMGVPMAGVQTEFCLMVYVYKKEKLMFVNTILVDLFPIHAFSLTFSISQCLNAFT